MAPIEARTAYRNYDGELVGDVNSITVYAGNDRILSGQVGDYKITCNDEDDGGSVELVSLATSAIKPEKTRLFGILPPKKLGKRVIIRHSGYYRRNINGKHGYDTLTVNHNPPREQKISVG